MLHSLQWLPTEQRIEYKLSLLCFKIISHQAPIYLSELLHLYTPSQQLCSSTDTRVFRIQSFRTTKSSGQHSILPNNKVQWSALFLLPGSSYLEPTPCFCPPFYLCQLFQIFLENLSLFKNIFFSPIAPINDCVCVLMLHALNFDNYVRLKNV